MWLQTLAAELPITLADGSVWLSIGEGLLIGAICLLFGVWVARFVGLLGADAPAGETLGVGLASGLLVLTSWWAAFASGGRSSFTPVAVGFAIAIGLAAVRRRRPAALAEQATNGSSGEAAEGVAAKPLRAGRLRSMALAVVGGAVFIIAVALLYGATLAPSPRDGVQPIEFMDEAYYSVLGADVARTGTESLYSPSGFTDIPGMPSQTWYHWGEAWLSAIAISLFGTQPLDARHLIALPLLLLAAAALTGTLVRRMTGSASRGAYLFGFVACLFLAPVPFARGLVFGITMYGLAASAVLFAIYGLAVVGGRRASWGLAVFTGSTASMILPAHVVIAVLGLVGVGSVWAIRIGRSLLATRRLPAVTQIWRRTYIATGILLFATVGWGFLTGHDFIAGGESPSVFPFNTFWREVVALTFLGAGAFLAIAIAWVISRGDGFVATDLYLGTMLLLMTGTLVWGARLSDFNVFHLFFGGLAIFGVPAAAIATWSIWLRLRARGYARLAVFVSGLYAVQITLGLPLAIERLQVFGPGTYPPVPLEILTAIRSMPTDAKLAYACQTTEESAFWDARLVALDAHTSRRIVPMCFEADIFGVLTGGRLSADVPSPLFALAPQRRLYPDSVARPSPAMVAAFLKENGIDYMYADTLHPNSLVPDAIPVATSGDTQILRLP